MDPKDSASAPPSPQNLQGSVHMAQPVYVAPPEPQPEQPGSTASVQTQETVASPSPADPAPDQTRQLQETDDTVIIPSAGGSSPPPQEPPGTDGGPVPPPPAPHGPNPLFKILAVGGVLAVLAVIGIVIMRLYTGSGAGVSGEPKNVTLQYWGLWENDEVTRQFIAGFEAKNPGITVQYTQESPKQYRERLMSAINRGEGPDVFRFHNTWIPMLRMQLATVPSDVMTVSEFSSTFFPVVVNNLVAGDSIFGIPLMIDGLGLYINDDLFATAGVSPPSTWTDLENIVPRLTVKNGTAIVTGAIALGTATNVEHYSDILGLLFYQNGANLLSLTGAEAEQALVFYRSFADPTSPRYTWSDGMDNSVSAFANGRVAMILAPSWRAHEIALINPKLRFHIEPVPQLQGNTVAWASYWVEGVNSRSPNQAAAWEFVKYMTGKEGAASLYSEEAKVRDFGEPYARIDLAETIQNDPFTGAYVKQAGYARSFPIASRTYDNGLNDRLIQYLTDAINGMAGGASPQKVLQTASAGFRQVLSSYELVNPPETPAAQ